MDPEFGAPRRPCALSSIPFLRVAAIWNPAAEGIGWRPFRAADPQALEHSGAASRVDLPHSVDVPRQMSLPTIMAAKVS